MDDVVHRFARELADAIAAAVAHSTDVEACRARAREAGYDLKVTLEAVVGFAPHAGAAPEGASPEPATVRQAIARQAPEMTANDRRFLRSLRIAADETKVEEAN